VRGTYELTVRGTTLAGLGATCAAIVGLATGFAAGAARLGAAGREETFGMLALITCPKPLWMLAKSAAIKQSAKNLDSFINHSDY
jgi:hypothetical protein